MKQDQRRRFEKPWLYDTGKRASDPPDINYTMLIYNDQETIDHLLKKEGLHYSQRCLNMDSAICGSSFVY